MSLYKVTAHPPPGHSAVYGAGRKFHWPGADVLELTPLEVAAIEATAGLEIEQINVPAAVEATEPEPAAVEATEPEPAAAPEREHVIGLIGAAQRVAMVEPQLAKKTRKRRAKAKRGEG